MEGIDNHSHSSAWGSMLGKKGLEAVLPVLRAVSGYDLDFIPAFIRNSHFLLSQEQLNFISDI